MSERSVCQYCHQAILWVQGESGKMFPVDLVTARGIVLESGTAPMTARYRNIDTSHLTTCKKQGGK